MRLFVGGKEKGMELKGELRTERLILRRYRASDLQDLYEYLSDAQVVKFEPYKPMSMDEVRENLAWRISLRSADLSRFSAGRTPHLCGMRPGKQRILASLGAARLPAGRASAAKCFLLDG